MPQGFEIIITDAGYGSAINKIVNLESVTTFPASRDRSGWARQPGSANRKAEVECHRQIPVTPALSPPPPTGRMITGFPGLPPQAVVPSFRQQRLLALNDIRVIKWRHHIAVGLLHIIAGRFIALVEMSPTA